MNVQLKEACTRIGQATDDLVGTDPHDGDALRISALSLHTLNTLLATVQEHAERPETSQK